MEMEMGAYGVGQETKQDQDLSAFERRMAMLEKAISDYGEITTKLHQQLVGVLTPRPSEPGDLIDNATPLREVMSPAVSELERMAAEMEGHNSTMRRMMLRLEL